MGQGAGGRVLERRRVKLRCIIPLKNNGIVETWLPDSDTSDLPPSLRHSHHRPS